jgi:hypothetical protein
MQITFPGPDGTPLTVADARREPIYTKPGKDVTIALPRERRLAAHVVGAMKV